MTLRHFSLLLALLHLAGLISAQEAAPQPQAVQPAAPAVAEEKADDSDYYGEDEEDDDDDFEDEDDDDDEEIPPEAVLAERRAKELQALANRLGHLSSRLRDQAARVRAGEIPDDGSLRKAAEEQAALVRQILRQEPLPVHAYMYLYLMAPHYAHIKDALIDHPAEGVLPEAEREALVAEFRASADALCARAHEALLKEGDGREAEQLRRNAAHIGVSPEAVAAMQKEADAAALAALEKSFHVLLDLQDYELGASQRVLQQMKEKGADGALVARLEAELQAAADRRLLALARSFRGGVTVFGSTYQIATLQDWARNMRLLPPGEAALPKLEALWAEVTAADLEKRLRYALRPERGSAPWQEVERMLKQAREAGLPAGAMAGAERIVRDETVFQLQRSLWSLLGSQGFDYGKAGQQAAQAAMILDYAAQHGVDEATLEEWRRQVKWLRDERLRRDFEWRLSTAKFDEAEALLKEAVDGGLDEAQAASLRQKLQTARQERQKWEFWNALGKRDADKADELLQLIEQQGIASNDELSDMREDLRMLKARRLEDQYRRAVQGNDEAKAEEVLDAARAIGVPEETLRHWHDAFHPKRRY